MKTWILLICMSLLVPIAFASTLDVCPVNCSYSTIQSAIDNSSNGDTISVAAGTYVESLVINKSLALQGEGLSLTIINGSQTIIADNVTLDGFRFNGGVVISDAFSVISGVTISHNFITGVQYGLRLGVTTVGLGINHVVIDGNVITGNTKRGILFYNRADYVAQGVSYVTIINNQITSNTDGGSNGGGISTYGSGYNTISNNSVRSNNGNGISVKYDDGDVITGNNVSGNTAMGINMHLVTNCTVENNSVSGQVSTGVVTRFWGGTVYAGKGSGIYIHENSHDNTVRLNNLFDNRIGILVNRESSGTNPSGNSINRNWITGNSEYSVYDALNGSSVNVTYNYWGTTDYNAINTSIYQNSSVVSYIPYYKDEGFTEIEYCEPCVEDWYAYFTNLSCNVSDFVPEQKLYLDLNDCNQTNDLPVDNGSISNVYSCNYCSEDIQEHFTAYGDCVLPEKLQERLRYYIDDNFASCCQVTGIAYDCHISNGSYANVTEQSACQERYTNRDLVSIFADGMGVAGAAFVGNLDLLITLTAVLGIVTIAVIAVRRFK